MSTLFLLLSLLAFAGFRAVKASPLYCNNGHHDDVHEVVFGDTCFAFFTSIARTHHDAEEHCRQEGGVLAMVKTSQVSDVLTGVLKDDLRTKKKFWIGLSDEKNEGVYLWSDGTEVPYQELQFHSSQGQNAYWWTRNGQDCVAMDRTGYWFDYRCKTLAPRKNHICQFHMSTATETPVTTESITTIIPPTTTTTTTTSKITSYTSTSDCKGPYRSAKEVVVTAYGESCYAFFNSNPKSFDFAESICETFGGTLAMVKTAEVNQVLTNVLSDQLKTTSRFWIGLSDEVREGDYRWPDQTKMTFSNFNLFEGNRVIFTHHFEDCVTIDKSGLWFDYMCHPTILAPFPVKHKFICEFKRSRPVPNTTTGSNLVTTPDPTTNGRVTKGHVEITTTQTNRSSTETSTSTTGHETTTTTTPLSTTSQQPTTTEPTTTEQPTTTEPTSTRQPTPRKTTTPTTTTTSTKPTTMSTVLPSPCPTFLCDKDCGLYGYKNDDVTGCSLCECDWGLL